MYLSSKNRKSSAYLNNNIVLKNVNVFYKFYIMQYHKTIVIYKYRQLDLIFIMCPIVPIYSPLSPYESPKSVINQYI